MSDWGGALPNLIALVAETGSPEGRATRVTMISAGMPIGGVFANGFVLATPNLDWGWVFHVGGAAPLVLGALMIFVLKESPTYLTERARADEKPIKPAVTALLFGGGRATTTLMLWTSFFCTLLVLYLMLNWLPSLMVSKGFARQEATLVALAFAVGGAIGALALGYLIGRGRQLTTLVVTYAGIAFGLALLALVSSVTVALAGAFVTGFFLVGAQFVLYGLSSTFYETSARGTGVGSAVAVGRFGAIAGPMLAGALLAAGGEASDTIFALFPLVVVALIAIVILVRRKA